MALKRVLEPIFEVDFYASSYRYRPGRRAQDAIAEIVHFANPPSSYEWVIEADVEACFDRLDHHVIMTEVGRRIGDRRILALVRAFLRAGVLTEAGQLERRLTGTPQGGIDLALAGQRLPACAGPRLAGTPRQARAAHPLRRRLCATNADGGCDVEGRDRLDAVWCW
jgi:hypothetical protein